MSKKAMRRSPTSRNERRKAIARKQEAPAPVCPSCGYAKNTPHQTETCRHCANVFRTGQPVLLSYRGEACR